MSDKLNRIEEPNLGLHLTIGLSFGTGAGMILASLNNFLIRNALVEAINLITVLMILRMLTPTTGALIGYAVYRCKYRTYMKSKFIEDIPTDF